MSERRVAITGLGVVSPIGIGAEAFWNALLEKQSGIERISFFDPSGFKSQVAGEVKDLKPANYVPKNYRKSVKIMARDIEIAVAAAYEAVRDAGLVTKCIIDRGEAEGPASVEPIRFGANIGAGLICADLTELAAALSSATDEQGKFDIHKWGSEGMYNLTPLWLLKFLPNMLSCHVTIVHDAQAPSNTITCGEASSHLAVGEAFRTITRGDADVCICGGAESKLNPMGLLRQELLDRLSGAHNDTPKEACRPFDEQRDGTVISEGGGLLILEELEHARKRGARIYGELVGFGAANNTHDWRTPHPQGKGLENAIGKALADAQLPPDAVDMITSFGTGIPEMDRSEARGLHAALGDRAAEIPTLAIKGAIGNNGAGSGSLDLVAAVQCLHNATIPASVNVGRIDPECKLNVVKDDARDAKISTAISVAYALGGGQNAALVIRKLEN